MSLADTLSQIKATFPETVFDVTEHAGEKIIHIQGLVVLDVLGEFQKSGFNFLADITAIDNMTLGGFERFAVVYHLLSQETAERVTVKAYVSEENLILPSVESLWKTADWQEREIYDLFGITFEGHPNLVRIMNPDDFEGHPLRKDYPRLGRKERDNFPIVERRIGRKARRE